MLYKKIIILPLAISSSLPRVANGGTYTFYGSANNFDCGPAGPNDICQFHCDEEKKSYSFDCGNAGQCEIFCDAKDCMKTGTLNAANVNFLQLNSAGANCFKQGTAYLPSFGNASLFAWNNGLRETNIYSGSNTQSIYIDCVTNGDLNDDCKDMVVHAQKAQHLEIYIGAGGELEQAIINCPINSTYKGSSGAPCIINATRNGILLNTQINTLNGIPMDLRIFGIRQYSGSVVHCADGSSDASNIWNNSAALCWNTQSPTMSPTKYTLQPTQVTSLPTKTTLHPTTLQPTTSDPTTDTPISAPTTINPTTANPTTSNPTTPNPTTSNPITANPTTPNPTTSNPTTPNPTTANPTTGNPTAINPTTTNPTSAVPTALTSIPTTPTSITSTPTTRIPTTSIPTISDSIIESTTPETTIFSTTITTILHHMTESILLHSTDTFTLQSSSNADISSNLLYIGLCAICFCICLLCFMVGIKTIRVQKNTNKAKFTIKRDENRSRIESISVNPLANAHKTNFVHFVPNLEIKKSLSLIKNSLSLKKKQENLSEKLHVVDDSPACEMVNTSGIPIYEHGSYSTDIVYKNSIEGANIPSSYEQKTNYPNDREQIKLWLEQRVELPQYFDTFIENGYDTIELIKSMEGKVCLQEIGIILKGHQNKLWIEIGNLEKQGDFVMNRVEIHKSFDIVYNNNDLVDEELYQEVNEKPTPGTLYLDTNDVDPNAEGV